MKLKDVLKVIPNNQLVKIRYELVDTNVLLNGDYELDKFYQKTVSRIFTEKQDNDIVKIWVYDR